jgi:hypothetical protein
MFQTVEMCVRAVNACGFPGPGAGVVYLTCCECCSRGTDLVAVVVLCQVKYVALLQF